MKIYIQRPKSRKEPSPLELYLDRHDLLSTSSDDADCIVLENIDLIPKTIFAKRRDQKQKTVLICYEPPVVNPSSYEEQTLRKFDYVISLGTVETGSREVTYWPQTFETLSTANHFSAGGRIPKIVMVSSDKLSFVTGERYSLRRECAVNLQDLDLYGQFWGENLLLKYSRVIVDFLRALMSTLPRAARPLKLFSRKPRNYLGPVSDKRATMSFYRLCLVIENWPYYVSEKLFDALFAGCIPVYVGPSLINFGIPPGLVFEAEPNLVSIQETVSAALTTDLVQWNRIRAEFLSDMETRNRWQADNVYGEIVRRLNRAVGAN